MAVEKGKEENLGKAEISVDRKAEKVKSLQSDFSESSSGEKTNLATVTATGYGRRTAHL